MFLPTNYEAPKSTSGYMKLQDGLNKLRVLSSAIVGYEYWNTDNKPVRSKEYPSNPTDIRVEKDGSKSKIKHFWAFCVWNYKADKDKDGNDVGMVQILEITQKTIQNGIMSLVNDEDYGDPKQYDLKITRSGEGLETSYSVMPSPAKELSMEVATAFAEKKVNLEALYASGDPFADTSYEGDKEEEIDLSNIPV